MSLTESARKLRRPSGYVPALVVTIAILLPLALTSSWQNILILTVIMAGVATSWNLFGGYTGYFSLGHVVFFGLGAYTTTLLYTTYGIPPVATIVVGMLLSVLASLLIGKATLSLDGHYFALATLGSVIIAQELFAYFEEYTGGPAGIQLAFEPGVTTLMFRNRVFNYYIAVGYLLGVLAITLYIDNRKFGYYLKAIREDEDATKMLGADTDQLKIRAFALSAALSSIGGSLWITYTLFIDPSLAFDLFRSLYFVLYPLIGGLGTIMGPVVGTVLIDPIRAIFSQVFGGSVAPITNMIYGLILMVVVLVFPEGIVKRLRNTYRQWIDRLPTLGADEGANRPSEEQQ